MRYTLPCVSFCSIIKPNHSGATLYRKFGKRFPKQYSTNKDLRLCLARLSDILRQNYLSNTLFWVYVSVFQQLLPSTHQALVFYHIIEKKSIVFRKFFGVFRNIYSLLIFAE